MMLQGVVTGAAGVVSRATSHFDGDDIERAAPVGAAGLRVEIETMNGWTHGGRVDHADAAVKSSRAAVGEGSTTS